MGMMTNISSMGSLSFDDSEYYEAKGVIAVWEQSLVIAWTLAPCRYTLLNVNLLMSVR